MAINWQIYDEDNNEILEDTSFISYNYKAQTQVAQLPLEEGSFAHYNKIVEATKLELKLAYSGSDSEISQLIKKLEEEKTKASKLSILSPEKIFNNFTLQSFNYDKEASSGIMIIDLVFQEIKEINLALSSSSLLALNLANACDASNTLRGQVQAIAANSSIISKISKYL